MASPRKEPASQGDVPFVDLKAQYAVLEQQIQTRINKVLAETQYVLGPEVQELEGELARFTGVRNVVGVANGTEALKIALLAAGIGPGDAVFVPAFTFLASAEVIVEIGATPVFVDVEEQTFTMDPVCLSSCIEGTVRQGVIRPAAIMPVDLFGLPANYATINALAKQHELIVLADAAQSLGGSIGGCRVGSLTDMTATSFYPSKPLGCYGDGGCIFVDDDERAAKMRIIRGHGLDSGSAVCIGLNSRLDTLQAAILLAKLEIFEAELEARAQIAGWYGDRLADIATTATHPDGYQSAWGVYSILIDNRDKVRAELTKQGIACAVYYATPLHRQPAYQQFSNGAGSLPVTEKLSHRIISLPMSGYVSEETVDHICSVIRSC